MRESEIRPRSARRTCTCGPESDDSCAPVCIATSRVAPPATRWATVHLRHMPHQGGEKCESPRTSHAARAALAHAVPSRTTAVRRFASPHLGLPLPPRVGRPCTCANMPHQGGEKCESPRTGPAARAALAHAVPSRTTAVRRFASPHLGLPLPPRTCQLLAAWAKAEEFEGVGRFRRSLHRSLTASVAAGSAPQPPHALGPEHARHEHRLRRMYIAWGQSVYLGGGDAERARIRLIGRSKTARCNLRRDFRISVFPLDMPRPPFLGPWTGAGPKTFFRKPPRHCAALLHIVAGGAGMPNPTRFGA